MSAPQGIFVPGRDNVGFIDPKTLSTTPGGTLYGTTPGGMLFRVGEHLNFIGLFMVEYHLFASEFHFLLLFLFLYLRG
jgi:hypothetical protein